MLTLASPIKRVLSTTGTYLKLLEEIGIYTLEDFLLYYPRVHDDQSKLSSIAEAEIDKVHTFLGTLQKIKSMRTKNNRQLVKAEFYDSYGNSAEVVWFNQAYLKNVLVEDREMLFTGKLQYKFGKFTIQSPTFEPIREEQIHTGRIVPIYREHGKITSKWIREKMAGILYLVTQIREVLPEEIMQKEGLIPRSEAIKKIHFPKSEEDIKEARKRLGFEELFFIQKRVLELKQKWHKVEGVFNKQIPLDVELIKAFFETLPFSFTNDQKVVLYEILKDMEKDYPMMRLLEGDVGSGKTIVVITAMLNVYKAGFQSIIMAPTEVLARQHVVSIGECMENFSKHHDYEDLMKREDESKGQKEVTQSDLFSQFMESRQPRIELLTGSITGKAREEILLGMRTGTVDIVIGTHALIQESIAFNNLGFAVIDEQHKFGVVQREKFKSYGDPHILNMSATPIPRSLALTAYGDQDLSVISEMPPGRKEIETKIVPPKNRKEIYNFIEDGVKKGKQVYVICPLIDESDVLEVKSAIKEQDFLQTDIFPKLTVGLLHGKLTSKEKAQRMDEFKRGDIDILVSTSVIEVGVDVSNATIMLIEGAERFGLAQLHQFRGRVGRGKDQSYCFLFTESSSPQTFERLRAMEQHKSGFALAEIDMKLRGPGEVYGIRQSGIPDLKIASLADTKLVAKVRKVVEEYMGLNRENSKLKV